MRIRVSVIVEPDGAGFYAHCPSFKGIHIDGQTVEEALERTCDALGWYLASLERHGDPLPVGPDCILIEGRPQVPVFTAPAGAFLEDVEVPWPSLEASGIS